MIALHTQAMEWADEASLERLRGNSTGARELQQKAFESERAAAALTIGEFDLEPTRSVLHRSAASLALECAETRQAERLIATALAGNPPAEIADELRDLLEQVYFQRHLDLRGIVLQPNEFQVSITGEAVGLGIADSDEVVGRVQDLKRLVLRTAERRSNIPFRENARPSAALARSVGVYLTVPRAASYAVSFRLGSSAQLVLPGMGIAEIVVSEIFDCLAIFADSGTEALRERIPDPAYLRNFVSLVKRIAPDGKSVRTVGFTAMAATGERRLALTQPAKSEHANLLQSPLDGSGDRVVVRGVLRFADSMKKKQGEIRLVDTGEKPHRVIVPTGMMDDIVRPLWDYEVVVTGTRKNRAILLQDVRRADEAI